MVCLSRRLSAVDRRVWLLSLLFVLVSTGWALAVPLFHPPDEQMHVDLIDALAHDTTYPGYADRRLDQTLSTFSGAYLQAGGASRAPRLGNLEAPVGTDTISLRPGRSTPSPQVNQMPQHPPLYYESVALALRAARSLHCGHPYPTIADEVLLLRLLNVLIVAPLPLLTWLMARELGGSDRMSLSAASLLLAVPQLTHIVGSVNNDNLLIVLGALLTWLVVRVVRRPCPWTTDVVLGLALGAALLTKAFAFVLVPWVVLAYAAAVRRQRSARAACRLIGVGTLALATSGWFWLRNVHRYGQVAPTVFYERAALHPHEQGQDHLMWLGRFLTLLPERFWGSIGRYAAPMPAGVVALATLLGLGCILAALVGGRARGLDRTALAMAVLPAVLLGGYVAQHAHHIYVVTGWFSFIQGRYLFAGIGGLAAVTAVGADRISRGRFGPVHALGIALVMQAIAAYMVLTAIWGGEGASLRSSITTMAVWSPLPGPLVALVGVAVLLTACASVRSLGRGAEAVPDPS